MCDVAAERRGIGAEVLLRASEPLEGLSVMQRRRGTTRLMELAKGPGGLRRRWRSIKAATASIYVPDV
jgi:DNA-3-methyladenine glycosylase